jgi:prepilin-type N-terminal cleavage/methylation domain-containing protein
MNTLNNKGFTLIELAVVSCMISVIASIAIMNYMPYRSKAFDSTALADARGLVESVIMATVNDEDVDYTKVNTGGPVGDIDTAGNPRQPVFVLSTGVAAFIIGDSAQAPNGDTTIFQAIIYHTNGTDDPASFSGKKEFTCSVDESLDTATLP